MTLSGPLSGPLSSALSRPIARPKGVGRPTFADMLALNPEIAFEPAQAGAAYQERTGASASTPVAVGDPIGSLKNFGTKGGWLVAATDNARPVLRASGALRYIETDGVDDLLAGSLEAFRGLAGWHLFIGVKNIGSTASSRVPLVIITGGGGTRASLLFAVTTGAATLSARRLATDTGVNVTGSAHANTDIILEGIGDYTNTDGFVLVNGVQEGASTSWLTSGSSDTLGGDVALGAFPGPAGLFVGSIWCAFGFPAVLSAGNAQKVRRYIAQAMGI